jgi:hypothetical protein
MVWVVAAFGLYMVKYKVQAIKVEVAATERQLSEAKKNLHVLNAEWTYLNRPQRLQELSSKYLDVKPMQGKQFSDLASFPYAKPAEVIQHVSADKSQTPEVRGVTLASGVAHDQ